jgi:hypothetical protein
MMIEEDFKDTLRCYPFAIGSYMIANNHRLQVDCFDRVFRLTVRQLVEKFGRYDDRTGKPLWEVFSPRVREMYRKCEYETWIDVCHQIKPNEDFNPKKLDSKYKRYSSIYYEAGIGDNRYGPEVQGLLLSEKGYDRFPVLCGRWEITGQDAYGTDCPGFTAIGDIKQLQQGEKHSAMAVEKEVRPAMIAPSSMKNSKSSILPGDISFSDEPDKFRRAHESRLDISALEQKQQQVRSRIQRAFYEDLFLMLANTDRRQITAREIDERHEEKLLALGPVYEQLNQDILDPLIDLTYEYMDRQGLIPPPPPELEGMELKIEYISVMAQAQRMIGIGALERVTSYAIGLASVFPGTLDKFNAEQALDEYGDMASIAPGVIRSDEDVDAMREQQARQQQAQAQLEAIGQVAKSAKDLSAAKMEDDNALTRLMGGA